MHGIVVCHGEEFIAEYQPDLVLRLNSDDKPPIFMEDADTKNQSFLLVILHNQHDFHPGRRTGSIDDVSGQNSPTLGRECLGIRSGLGYNFPVSATAQKTGGAN
jgi:hypothetical protein